MSKKIVISGSYGNGNSGDETILYSIIRELRSIDKDIDITVLSKNPSSTKNEYGVKSIHTFNIIKIIILFIKSDLFISGGGTLLQNITSTRSLLYYLWTLLTAKICHTKVLMYGCGIGPIKGNNIRKITTYILNKYVDEILLRDSLSYEELKGMKVNMDNVSIGIDPSILFDKHIKIDNNILSKLNIKNGKKYVGICLSIYSWNILNDMNKIINYLNKLDYIPILIPMNYNEDLDILKKLSNKLNNMHYLIDKDIDFISKYSLISKMNLVISSRLHAVLFSYLNNISVIGISYDKKMDTFCNDYGIKNYIDNKEFNYDRFIKEYNNLKINNINYQKINKLKNKNYEILNKYLKD